ncbi:unnamed protein product [Chondrus crispus]|uniref:Uncharacterized protein n=1 Tax=Chondrus crispus TaxID=2769 RepID=R7QKH9_CHOCR|nr:unnamed protein product [Chondrus crispus]CDF39007.1 unnamed protein product [Chondrus crispus]|eukprot:XP_005718912.1 unnamed protein product [Chondrus crispus]
MTCSFRYSRGATDSEAGSLLAHVPSVISFMGRRFRLKTFVGPSQEMRCTVAC